MNLVVLDGYTTNPGDCSWDPVAKFGSLDVFERSAVQEIQQRALTELVRPIMRLGGLRDASPCASGSIGARSYDFQ